jgi:CheY-like chemotaxis protein
MADNKDKNDETKKVYVIARSFRGFLKSDVVIKHIPVILFSALPGLEHIYPECEATGYIAKPFDAKDLFGTIERYLKAS